MNLKTVTQLLAQIHRRTLCFTFGLVLILVFIILTNQASRNIKREVQYSLEKVSTLLHNIEVISLAREQFALTDILDEIKNRTMFSDIFVHSKDSLSREIIERCTVFLDIRTATGSCIVLRNLSLFTWKNHLATSQPNFNTVLVLRPGPLLLLAFEMESTFVIPILIVFALLFIVFRTELKQTTRLLLQPISYFQKAIRQVSGEELVPPTPLSEEEEAMLRTLQHYKKFQDEIVRLRKDEAAAEVAKQVAHDLASPLAALEMATRVSHQDANLQRLTLGAVKSIREISATLKRDSTKTKEQRTSFKTATPLLQTIDEFLDEKRLEYGDTTMSLTLTKSHQQDDTTIPLDQVSFKRILSNLTNNAIDACKAIDRCPEIQIIVEGDRSHFRITIRDNGKGIDPKLLPRIGQMGASFEKPNGSGLGLYHARTTIEQIGGRLNIASQPGLGTSVTLEIPVPE